MIASKGHLLGYEDVINDRFHTATAKCMSAEAIIFKWEASEFISKQKKENSTWEETMNIALQNDNKTK